MQMKIYTTISVYTYSALYKSAYLAAFGKLLYDPYGCFTFTFYIISNDSNRSKCRLTSRSVAGPWGTNKLWRWGELVQFWAAVGYWVEVTPVGIRLWSRNDNGNRSLLDNLIYAYTYTRICFASAIIKLLDKASLNQESQTQEVFLNIAKY